jgi:hypothetical protein
LIEGAAKKPRGFRGFVRSDPGFQALPYFFPFLAAFLAAFFLVDLGLAVETADDFDFLPKIFSQFFENSGLAPERTIGPLIARSSFPKTMT